MSTSDAHGDAQVDDTMDDKDPGVPTVAQLQSGQKKKKERLRRPRPCPVHKLKGRGCEEDCSGRTFFKPSYKPTRREISLIHVSNGTQGAFDLIRLNPELFECGSRLPWSKPTSAIEDLSLTSYEGPTEETRLVTMHVVMQPDSDQFYALFDWSFTDTSTGEQVDLPVTPVQNGRIISFPIDLEVPSIHVTVTARVPVPNPATKTFETFTCSLGKTCLFPPVEKLVPIAPVVAVQHDGQDVDEVVGTPDDGHGVS